MKPADFTLPFYRKCLSQHLWDWRSRFVTTAVVRHHEANEDMLKQVAHERGDEFLKAYNVFSPQPIFPFAGIPAPETTQTPSTTTSMKLEITIPDELFNPIVQAIDRLTEAVKAGGLGVPSFAGATTARFTSSDAGASITTDGPITVIEGTTEADKPKRGRKSKEPEATPVTEAPPAEPTPAPVVEPEVVTAVVEAPPAAVPVPTGPELAAKAGPLAAHPELQQDLIRFKSNELKINGPIRLVTDEEQLRLFNIKLDELLAKIPAEV